MTDRVAAAVRAEAVIAPVGAVPLTVTIGGATSPLDTPMDVDVLLRRADEALYMAKTAGRDRVTSAPVGAAVAMCGA